MRGIGLVIVGAMAAAASAQTPRIGVSAGMGVLYSSPNDIITLVNSTSGALERIPQFHAGAEFFGVASFPLNDDWIVKLDYGYEVTSYNIATVFETAQYTVTLHCPTLILQRSLAERGVFNVRAGVGAGYHFGSLSEKYLYVDNMYRASGPGFLAEVEGNTALGDHLFVHLGVNARWEIVGSLTDVNGRHPGQTTGGGEPSLNSVGVGARLGFTYYF
jgi:hypothetical protein